MLQTRAERPVASRLGWSNKSVRGEKMETRQNESIEWGGTSRKNGIETSLRFPPWYALQRSRRGSHPTCDFKLKARQERHVGIPCVTGQPDGADS